MIKCLLTFTSVLGMACIIAYTCFIWCCILKMDKLVKLLNEYEREREWLLKDFEDYTMWDIEWNKIVQSSCDPDSREYFKYYIISKDYQFIKWLVDNDKINWWRIENNQDYAEYLWSSLPIEEYGVEILLMLLSIADDPINYLCCLIRQF